MTLSSHRLRAEENKLMKKLIGAVILFILTIAAVFYIGLPVLINFVSWITSLKTDKTVQTTNNTDRTVLFAPVFDPVAEATNSSPISVSGFGDKGSFVKIYVNGKESIKVATDKVGRFIASKIKLEEGENIITARVIKDDKISTISSPLTVIFRNKPPKLDISSPKDGDKFYSDNKEIYILGETDIGNRVMINDRLVIVDNAGKFSLKITLSSGENKFKIIALDKAENKSEEERKVTYNP